MIINIATRIAAGCLALSVCMPGFAAGRPAAGKSIAATIQILTPEFDRLNTLVILPVLTKVTDLPVVNKVRLPIVGGLNTIPIAEGQITSLLITAAPNVAILQKPLPGLGLFNSTLEAVLPKAK